jgi:hypothetical protein
MHIIFQPTGDTSRKLSGTAMMVMSVTKQFEAFIKPIPNNRNIIRMNPYTIKPFIQLSMSQKNRNFLVEEPKEILFLLTGMCYEMLFIV